MQTIHIVPLSTPLTLTQAAWERLRAADRLFLITKYLDKRGRYCFRMDEILDPETVGSVSVFGETFSVES